VLKHFENQGRRATDLPLVEWSVRTLMYQAQEALHAFLRNLPNRWAARILRVFIFPRGRTYSAPDDELGARIVELMSSSGEARERLAENAYTTVEPGNPVGLLAEALALAERHEPLEKRLYQARKEGLIKSEYLGLQIGEAERAGVIDKDEAEALGEYHEKVMALLAVDDFAPDELSRRATGGDAAPARQAAKRKAPPRKKTATGKKKKSSRKKKAASEKSGD
jgi:acyl-CoA dehydrogenase